jgi:hypothetical protein
MNWISGEHTHERVHRPSLDWDVYRVPVDGSRPAELVAERGLWASHHGADEIVFVRDAAIVARTSNGERTLLDGDRIQPFFENVDFRQPHLSEDGRRIAVELAVWRHQVGLWDVEAKRWTEVGEGRQIAWGPGEGFLYWASINGEGNACIDRRAVAAGSFALGATTTLLDLPRPVSRETFPRLSNDGRWLAFAAAPSRVAVRQVRGPAGGGDRPTSVIEEETKASDDAAFDLYLWPVGAGASAVVRLTVDDTFDGWPDVFVPPPPEPRAPDGGAATENEDGSLEGCAASLGV